jgi:uncharacterized membrane protein YbhN (UPF0104 family)
LSRTAIWRAVAAAAALAVIGLVAHTALASRGELSAALALASHPAAGWMLLAAGCEVVSYLAYATAQRRLLRCSGHSLGLGWLASLAVTAQAMNNFVPAGYLAANVLNFRQLRRTELSAPVTGWVLLTTSALNIGALAALAVVGSEIAGGGGAVLGWSCLGLVGLACLGMLGRRHAGAVTARLPDRVRSALRELGRIRLTPRAAGLAGVLLAVCWIADAACLVSAFLAIGARPPWAALLLAYSVAQLLSFLPLTPGGLGVVEGSLTLALAATGVGLGHVLAAVLVYRLLSYWATLPLGAAGYLNLRRDRSRVRPAPTLAWVWPLPSFALRSSDSR